MSRYSSHKDDGSKDDNANGGFKVVLAGRVEMIVGVDVGAAAFS